MIYALGKPGPVRKELVAARGDRPAVTVLFNPQPSPLSLRAARRMVADILRDGLPDAQERAGDAFSAAIIRHNIVGWEGIGDADDQPVEPTHDRELRDVDGEVTGIEPGTITAFLAEPRLVEAADREYVLPWIRLDAEKNGFAPSPAGTGAEAMQDSDTASSPATLPATGDAERTRKARKPARTKSTKPRPTKASASGRSSPE